MTTATFTPAPAQAAGATAVGTAPHSSHPLGNALRAVKVFASAVVSVVILGEYSN
jgi:hypothetical protein